MVPIIIFWSFVIFILVHKEDSNGVVVATDIRGGTKQGLRGQLLKSQEKSDFLGSSRGRKRIFNDFRVKA